MLTKQIWVTPSITDYKSSDVEGVGSIREVDGKLYRWVKNGDASGAWTVGQSVLGKPADNANFAKIGYTALAATTTPLTCLHGVAVSAVPYNNYGWVLILGYYASISVYQWTQTTTCAIGDNLKAVVSQEYFDKDTAVGTAPTVGGGKVIVLEAVTTTTTAGAYAKQGFVRCV